MTNKLFFDTYALVEIYKGNPNYERYKQGIRIILNKLNLLEFIYFLIREGKEKDIKGLFENLLKYNVEYDEQILIKTAEMKFKYLSENLSFIDCLGYLLAKKNNARFLTGDERFKHRENVEFVK